MEQGDPDTNHSDIENDSEILKFLLSCIVTCFKAILYNIHHDQGNTKAYTTHIFWNQTANAKIDTSSFNILSCGLLWMSRLVDQITFQMGEPQRKINWIVHEFRSYSSHFFNLSSCFISALTQSKSELKSIDASFRLSLAFIQSLLKLDFWGHQNTLLHLRSASESTVILDGDKSTETSVGADHNQIWDALILTIQKSKVSYP
jgi:hypothetical protein